MSDWTQKKARRKVEVSTGPQAARQRAVEALISIESDRPTAAYNELSQVAEIELATALEAPTVEERGKGIKNVCMKHRTAVTKAFHNKMLLRRGQKEGPDSEPKAG